MIDIWPVSLSLSHTHTHTHVCIYSQYAWSLSEARGSRIVLLNCQPLLNIADRIYRQKSLKLKIYKWFNVEILTSTLIS